MRLDTEGSITWMLGVSELVPYQKIYKNKFITRLLKKAAEGGKEPNHLLPFI
jgi:hypothetical protein